MKHHADAPKARSSTKSKKKEVAPISEFKKNLAKAYFNQKVLAALSVALIDCKKSNNWNQSDIAHRIDMDAGQVSRIMTGRQSNITIDTIALLVAAMECEPDFEIKQLNEANKIVPHSKLSCRVKRQIQWHAPEEDKYWEDGKVVSASYRKSHVNV